MKQETFGPLIAAMAVDDFDQALAYANNSDYGLSAYLFTRDNRKIMRAVNELEFGEIYVNRPSGESPHGFHTGFRNSGLGGEDGQHGIEGFMHKKKHSDPTMLCNSISYETNTRRKAIRMCSVWADRLVRACPLP